MNLYLFLLIGVVLQTLLGIISKKIKYEYSSKSQLLAIFINLFVWYFLYKSFQFNIDLLLVSFVTSFLIAIVFIDLKYHEIPNSYNAMIAFLGVVFVFLNHQVWLHLVLGCVISFGIFLALNLITKGNLGMGDVKLAGGLGFFCGTSGIVNFLISTFFAGSIVSLLLLLLKVKKKEDKIAFAPYIAIGFLYTYLL